MSAYRTSRLWRCSWLLLLSAGLPIALAGCGTVGSSDDKVASFFVAPGKYRLYDCAQLDDAAPPLVVRERELKGLIAEAGTGVGGKLVSATAYKPEYYQVLGDLNEIRARAVELNCKDVPGEMVPTADGSLDGVRRDRR
jgi:hypothetical protein